MKSAQIVTSGKIKPGEHFELKAKGRDLVFEPEKSFEILNSTSPAWIHSTYHQVPLNGHLVVNFHDPTYELLKEEAKKARRNFPIEIVISSIQSRGIRQVTFSSKMVIQNCTGHEVTLKFQDNYSLALPGDSGFVPLPIKSDELFYIE